MVFRKFAVAVLLAGGVFAASPAYASFSDFHWLNGDHKTIVIDIEDHQGDTNNQQGDGACQNGNCNSHGSTPDVPNWGPGDTRDPPVSAVPEPATWAMFLLGFGGIGVFMRRARRKETSADVTA